MLFIGKPIGRSKKSIDIEMGIMAEGGGTVQGTVRRPSQREEHALPSSTATDLGTGISPSPGSRRRTRRRSSAPARNSNSETSSAALLSCLAAAGISGVEVISESEMAKRYQLQLV